MASRLKLRTDAPEAPTAGAGTPSAAHDVKAILAANRAASDPFEKPLDLTPRSSRRKRDYWTVMVLGNGSILGLAALLPFNAVVGVYALSGVVVFSIGLTWVVWFVMDNY